MFRKILTYIRKSLVDISGKTSHTRISSYFILATILTSSSLFIMIDLGNAITCWTNGKEYTIPVEHIGILGLILSHHLMLLGIKNNSESKIYSNGNYTTQVGGEKKDEQNTEEV